MYCAACRGTAQCIFLMVHTSHPAAPALWGRTKTAPCPNWPNQGYTSRMVRHAHSLFVLIVLAGGLRDAAGMQAQPASKPAPQLVTSDSPFTTPEGATFIVAAGWSVAKDI